MNYSFSYDEQRILLTVIHAGFWSMETFQRYRDEYLSWDRKIHAQHRNYRVLSDSTDHAVVSGEMAAAFVVLAQELMENKGHHAIVVGTRLGKLQAERLIPDPNVKVFIDKEAAMAWLFEPGSLPED